MTRFDIVIAGGGLSGGLLALALARHRPELRVAVVEEGPHFGGNHTWSSFETDFTPAANALVEPLIESRWGGYDVRFPDRERRVPTVYRSATSERLDMALRAALPDAHLLAGARIAALRCDAVELEGGRVLGAGAVVDARGAGSSPALELGWQKFVGLEVETSAPHGLPLPIVMDATVDQLGGYRFLYTLPFAPDRLLIEDTVYADGPDLDGAGFEARIHAYAQMQGWQIKRVIRREEGVLPIAIGGDIDRHLAGLPAGIAPIGLRAGLFHPVTGYSLPDAAALALYAATLPDLSGPALDKACRNWARARWEKRKFYRMLNVMLFRAARPDERWRILQRFYGLKTGLVERFYAGHSSMMDRVRILAGRPPVPVGRAVRALLETR